MSSFVTAKDIREVGLEVPSNVPDDAVTFRHRLRGLYGEQHESGSVTFEAPFYDPKSRKRIAEVVIRLPAGKTIPHEFLEPMFDVTKELADQLGLFK